MKKQDEAKQPTRLQKTWVRVVTAGAALSTTLITIAMMSPKLPKSEGE